MPAMRYYRNLPFNNAALALKDFCRWLVNDHPTETGPGLKIVEAYDADNGLDKRRVPTGGDENNFENAAFAADGTFSWTGANLLATNDWIVLQSTHVANAWQILLQCSGTSEVYAYVFPYGNFATGGGDVSPPVFPSPTLYNGGTSYFTFLSNRTSLFNLCGISDGEFFQWAAILIGVAKNGGYFGQVEGANPSDTNPYIGHAVGDCTVSGTLRRISRLDNTTLVDCVWDKPYATDYNNGGGGYGGLWLPLIVGISCTTAGHRDFIGYPRALWSSYYGIGTVGTIDVAPGTNTYAYFGDASESRRIWPWDGATPLP